MQLTTTRAAAPTLAAMRFPLISSSDSTAQNMTGEFERETFSIEIIPPGPVLKQLKKPAPPVSKETELFQLLVQNIY